MLKESLVALVAPKQPTARSNLIVYKPETWKKLFLSGATIGPVVDSLHNQCLLVYDRVPINISWPFTSSSYIFCSSLFIPFLLGLSYVVLGNIIPQLFSILLPQTDEFTSGVLKKAERAEDNEENKRLSCAVEHLQLKAFLAVSSTGFIIKLSAFLELHSLGAPINLLLMSIMGLLQWYCLDQTLVALLIGIVVGIGGPLAELPFIAYGFWHYLPSAANYFPLSGAANMLLASGWEIGGDILKSSMQEYSTLGLSGITGPCYFAVTMDAIALGRYFEASNSVESAQE